VEPLTTDCDAGDADIEKSGGAETVNVNEPLVPLAVVTVNPRGPGEAPAATERVAVIRVELATNTFEAVTPEPEMFSALPYRKLAPNKVICMLLPGKAPEG
jgi:hypothetical protein